MTTRQVRIIDAVVMTLLTVGGLVLALYNFGVFS